MGNSPTVPAAVSLFTSVATVASGATLRFNANATTGTPDTITFAGGLSMDGTLVGTGPLRLAEGASFVFDSGSVVSSWKSWDGVGNQHAGL